MVESRRCLPLVYDYVELRLRMPVPRPREGAVRDSLLALPISRLI
jgi:hypothetical protein